MRVEQLDFFPMSRAMSLAKENEDETDTKLDELNEKVDLLVQKMREQVRPSKYWFASIFNSS